MNITVLLSINAFFERYIFNLFHLGDMQLRFSLISSICSHRNFPWHTNRDMRSATMGGVLLNFPFISFDPDTCILDGIFLSSSWQCNRKRPSYQTSWKSFFSKENKDKPHLSKRCLHSASLSGLQKWIC